MIFGEVASAATTVTVQHEDGSTDEAVVVAAPRNLGVDVKFFVYAMPGPGDVTLVAQDRAGEVLGQETLMAYPVLSVEKAGDGAGVVTSYHTELLAAGIEDAQARWIDCGTLCTATLDGADVTLKAVASEGSVFSGWSGDCTGAGDCVLEVSSDSHVVAHFDPAP